MGDKTALVGNAADRQQVKRAGRKVRDRRANELADLRAVLATPPGERTIWRLLQQCGVFRSVFDTNGSRVFYNAGQQDTGHWLMAEIEEADDAALFRLMQSAKQRERREALENEAMQTPRAEDETP